MRGKTVLDWLFLRERARLLDGLTAVVLAWLISALAITSLMGGLLLGLLTGVGFIATAMASDSAFCGWGVKLFVIQSGYRVAYSAIMGAVLGAWQ